MAFYKVAIWIILLLGIGHAAYTFKKYQSITPEALWFFSASLGLIFNGLLNYINLNIHSKLISNITIGANIFQTLFFVILSFYIVKPTTIVAFIVAAVLLFFSLNRMK